MTPSPDRPAPAAPTSATGEQAWIESHIAAGIEAPQWACVRYRQPAVIQGRGQPRSPEAERRAHERGYAIVQRRTGGGAVFAGPWLMGVNVLLPPRHALARSSHVALFHAFGGLWADVLQSLAVPCRLAQAADVQRQNGEAHRRQLDWSCFAGLGHGELLDRHGLKLLGLAQSRGPWGCLLSAGLLLGPVPWEALAFVLQGADTPRSGMHGLASPGAFTSDHGPASNALERALLAALPPFLGLH